MSAQNDDGNELASQPHDAFFKDFFSDTAHATGFFEAHLPADIAQRVSWDSLQLVPSSFVKRTLQQAHSDLLFSARTDGGQELLLYLLFEHQTSLEPAMPLRLLAYQVEILLAHHSKNGLPLPPVICYVLNQGPKEWTVSRRFEDLFQLSNEDAALFHDYLPKFEHALLDLTQMEPGDSEASPELRVVLQLMKLAREMEMMQFFEWLLLRFEDSVRELPDSLIRKILLYALHAESDLDVERIARTLVSNSSLKETVMSVAEKLIEKGKAEGKAEGVWIGKVQLMEEMLGIEQSQQLAQLSLSELEERFLALQKRYQSKFKEQ